MEITLHYYTADNRRTTLVAAARDGYRYVVTHPATSNRTVCKTKREAAAEVDRAERDGLPGCEIDTIVEEMAYIIEALRA